MTDADEYEGSFLPDDYEEALYNDDDDDPDKPVVIDASHHPFRLQHLLLNYFSQHWESLREEIIYMNMSEAGSMYGRSTTSGGNVKDLAGT
jgi:hypothetical protein